MKIIALDIGDVHTGVARADELGMFAKPSVTVDSPRLMAWLKETCAQQAIESVVVGLPKTLRNTHSQQTNKVLALYEELKTKFPEIEWILWDERLTSKQASQLVSRKTKSDKERGHAVAAAFILQSYLDYLRLKNEKNIDRA